MLHCDINCDMGEGIGNDELIMPYITSANIACGFHAGDEETMKQTIIDTYNISNPWVASRCLMISHKHYQLAIRQ